MTIRSRLLLFYGLMLLMVVVVAATSIWSMARWRTAADNLAIVQTQSVRSEKLRAAMNLQVKYALRYLAGETDFEKEFWKVEPTVVKNLLELKAGSLAPEETDHIEGLEETKYEMDWIAKSIFKKLQAPAVEIDIVAARARLEEISEEVFDDVAVLNQYYHTKVDRNIMKATEAGAYATIVINGAVILTLIQLLVLIFLTQRWLIRPIESINQATKVISSGNFDIEIPISSKDEWGHLAQSINDMAISLKSMRQQLRSQERLAAMGEAAAYTAHNIQNPLAGIRAAAQVTRDELGPDQKKISQSLGDIIQVVDRLDLWVKRFLSYAKPLQLRKEMTNLNNEVDQVIAISYSKFSNSDIEIEKHFDETLPLISIDPLLIQQALTAILTNSLESGGNKVKVCTSLIHDEENNSWAAITTTDNGVGISSELMPKLFKSFVSGKKGGTGLGLAQAKKIIDLHAGQLGFETQVGRGTSVVVKLPVDTDIRTNV